MNLVTGATGLLGSHIVEKLIAQGQPVRVLVRSSSDTRVLDEWGVEKVIGDITDPESLKAAMQGVDTVYVDRITDWIDENDDLEAIYVLDYIEYVLDPDNNYETNNNAEFLEVQKVSERREILIEDVLAIHTIIVTERILMIIIFQLLQVD